MTCNFDDLAEVQCEEWQRQMLELLHVGESDEDENEIWGNVRLNATYSTTYK